MARGVWQFFRAFVPLCVAFLPHGSATCQCAEVCPCYGKEDECREVSCWHNVPRCKTSYMFCRGWCSCNTFGCNCEACGDCSYPKAALIAAPLASDVSKDHQHFFNVLSMAERLAHLGNKYGCDAGQSATEAFYEHVVTSADTDGNGVVSPEEFGGAHSIDLSSWLPSHICAAGEGAAAQQAAIGPHYPDSGVPADADGAAFLQAPRLDL